MLEYTFFNEQLRTQFIRFMQKHNIYVQLAENEEEYIVQLPDDLDDSLCDEVDELYFKLLQQNAELIEAGEDPLARSAAGITLTLSDGRRTIARIDPDILSRMLNCISLEELHNVACAIADAVENPDDRPICHGD